MKNKELALSYFFTLVALILTAISSFILPSQIPLWYSLVIPEQQLVPKIFLSIFPILMILICITHTIITGKLKKIDSTIVKIFSFGTTLVNFLLLVGLVHIIYIFL